MRLGPATPLALLVAGAVIVGFCFHTDAATRLRMERASRLERWSDVLTEACRLVERSYDLMVNRAVNRALYHKGWLLDELCSFPQEPLALLPSIRQNPENLLSPYMVVCLSDTYLDLGLVNESEHTAQEAFEYLGPRPWLLRRLALTETVKGRDQIVGLFLRTLSGDLMFGKLALAGAKAVAPPAQDAVQQLRGFMVRTDAAADCLPPEKLLVALLKRNSRNRMAFEYLMAYYLLTKQLDRVVDSIGRLGDMGYQRIPRHCEEALLLYASKTRKPLDLRGLTISRATAARFAAFSRAMRDHSNDGPDARRAAAQAYQDTYFFYYDLIPLEATE